jgi:hypothetical protein
MSTDGPNTVRESQIKEQLNCLGNVMQRIEGDVDVLEGRLRPVTKDELPSDPEGDTKEEELVPLAAEMRELHRSFCHIASRLESINERLEL